MPKRQQVLTVKVIVREGARQPEEARGWSEDGPAVTAVTGRVAWKLILLLWCLGAGSSSAPLL